MFWSRRTPAAPRYAVFSDVGPVRKRNEDACGAFGPEDGHPGEHLFVVADGMGGHAHGEEASALTLDVVYEAFVRGSGSAPDRLRRAVVEANGRVWAAARSNGDPKSMGTTCTAVCFVDGHAYLAHVGDSRAYRLDGRGLHQLTRDHTLVEELRRNGSLTKEQAEAHPQRHALVRAVGIAPEVEVDVQTLGPLRRGERYLLCSDGIAPVQTAEIVSILLHEEPEAACRKLVARAAAAGSTDNATAVVVYL